MKHLAFILFFIFIPKLTFSQKDCVMEFTYNGEIKSEKYTIIKIKLPSTEYISGYETFRNEYGNMDFTIDSLKFSFKIGSHMSSEFCGEKERIIKDTFKKVKFYPIIIYYKNKSGKLKSKKLKIPIEKMRFIITKENELEIEFPLIEL